MTHRTAQSLPQYIEAWEHHIQQLAILALAANIDYDEYRQIKDTLTTWLDKATDKRLNHE